MNPLGLEDQKSVISSTGRRIDQITGSVIVDPELAAEFARISGSSPRKTTNADSPRKTTYADDQNIDDDLLRTTARRAQTVDGNSFDSLDGGSYMEQQDEKLMSVQLKNDMVTSLLDDHIDSKISQQKGMNILQEDNGRVKDPEEFRQKFKPEKPLKHEFIVDEDNGGTLRIKTMNFFSPNKTKESFLDKIVNLRSSEDIDAELNKMANAPNKYFQQQDQVCRVGIKDTETQATSTAPGKLSLKDKTLRAAATAEGGRRSSLVSPKMTGHDAKRGHLFSAGGQEQGHHALTAQEQMKMTQTFSFSSVPRTILQSQENKLVGSGVDSNLYNPKFTKIHKRIVKNVILAPGQDKQRTFYFEGHEADLYGAQPDNLQRKQKEIRDEEKRNTFNGWKTIKHNFEAGTRTNRQFMHRTIDPKGRKSPETLCSKGSKNLCFGSIRRIKNRIKDFPLVLDKMRRENERLQDKRISTKVGGSSMTINSGRVTKTTVEGETAHVADQSSKLESSPVQRKGRTKNELNSQSSINRSERKINPNEMIQQLANGCRDSHEFNNFIDRLRVTEHELRAQKAASLVSMDLDSAKQTIFAHQNLPNLNDRRFVDFNSISCVNSKYYRETGFNMNNKQGRNSLKVAEAEPTDEKPDYYPDYENNMNSLAKGRIRFDHFVDRKDPVKTSASKETGFYNKRQPRMFHQQIDDGSSQQSRPATRTTDQESRSTLSSNAHRSEIVQYKYRQPTDQISSYFKQQNKAPTYECLGSKKRTNVTYTDFKIQKGRDHDNLHYRLNEGYNLDSKTQSDKAFKHGRKYPKGQMHNMAIEQMLQHRFDSFRSTVSDQMTQFKADQKRRMETNTDSTD